MKLAIYGYFLLACAASGMYAAQSAHVESGTCSSSHLGTEFASKPVPSLKYLVYRSLVPYPGEIAKIHKELYAQKDICLFVNSVHYALSKRLGFRAFADKDIPLDVWPVKEMHVPLAFSHDGAMLIGTRPGQENGQVERVCLVDVPQQKVLGCFEGSFGKFSSDGKIIAIQNGKNIDFFTIKTGEKIRSVPDEKFEGFSDEFGPENTAFVTSKTFRDVMVRMIQREDPLFTLPAHRFGGLSPDGSVLSTRVENEKHQSGTWLWNIFNGEPIFSFENEYFKNFAPDGRSFATLAYKLSLMTLVQQLFFVGMENELRVRDTSTGEIKQTFEGLRWPTFSPDGQMVINNGYSGLNVTLWDVKTGKLIDTLPGYLFVAFSPDSTLLLLRRKDEGDADAAIHLWDIKQRRFVRSIASVHSPVLSPDGTKVAARSVRRVVMLEPNFIQDLQKIAKYKQQGFLLKAAQDWLKEKPHRVESGDANYLKVIATIPYLKNPLLFETEQMPLMPTSRPSHEASSYAQASADAMAGRPSSSVAEPVIVGSSSGENEAVQGASGIKEYLKRFF